jgi:hypothetical protein
MDGTKPPMDRPLMAIAGKGLASPVIGGRGNGVTISILGGSRPALLQKLDASLGPVLPLGTYSLGHWSFP